MFFQGTADLHHQGPRLPDWPDHQEKLGPCQQTGRHCLLFLRQHTEQLSHHQCGWIQGMYVKDYKKYIYTHIIYIYLCIYSLSLYIYLYSVYICTHVHIYACTCMFMCIFMYTHIQYIMSILQRFSDFFLRPSVFVYKLHNNKNLFHQQEDN